MYLTWLVRIDTIVGSDAFTYSSSTAAKPPIDVSLMLITDIPAARIAVRMSGSMPQSGENCRKRWPSIYPPPHALSKHAYILNAVKDVSDAPCHPEPGVCDDTHEV
uniref:Uncharacterized protein n=1 Tax=Coccolithus braarudii TaxID=221442 RepID=A0A7S0LB63_9EUKA|mmetsp:Transcript_30817/g.66200  ORF Transcript_30817/g.66200 Transcript_30817/m.66200 type:complete len:106 (+) Transcript_30817:68-385(+)